MLGAHILHQVRQIVSAAILPVFQSQVNRLLKNQNHCQQNPIDEPSLASGLAFVQLPSACSSSNQSAGPETLLRVHKKAL